MGGPGEAALGGLGAQAAIDGAEGSPELGMIADLFGAGPSYLVNRDPGRAIGVAAMTALAAAAASGGLPINMTGGISQPTPINSPQREDRRRRFGFF